MRSHSTLILFIVGIIITSVTIGIFTQIIGEQKSDIQPELGSGPTISGVHIWEIQQRQSPYITIEVTGGDQSVHANDSLITISTPTGTGNYLID